MKIIEAMKRVKLNKEKIKDLQNKISINCANMSYETPQYGENTSEKIKEWIQSCVDLSQENIRLLCAIQKTNLQTDLTIELNNKQVTKTIAEWVWRRREYAALDFCTWSTLTDRNLKEGFSQDSLGKSIEVKIVRHYKPSERDEMKGMYRDEPKLIDAALEIMNATTDLIEVYQLKN